MKRPEKALYFKSLYILKTFRNIIICSYFVRQEITCLIIIRKLVHQSISTMYNVHIRKFSGFFM